MKNDVSIDTPAPGVKLHPWIIFAICLVIYLALRLPGVGHLVNYDEAMNLCSVRSFAANGSDYYSRWFWHHPPMLGMLMLLAKPLSPHFAERTELLLIAVGCLNLLALFLLNRETLGTGPALWSVFLFAVMPSSIFFDLWIKQDALVVLFGLLSLYFFLRQKTLVSGVFLGFGFLAKETAMFYAIAIAMLWWLQGPARRFRNLLAVAAVSIAVSAWWYQEFSVSIKYFIQFALDSGNLKTDASVWAKPWYYFLAKMPIDFGILGILLAIAGVIALIRAALNARRDPRAADRWGRSPGRYWPLMVFFPGFIIFCMATGKAPWFTIALLPAFASLEGFGLWSLLALLRDRIEPRLSKVPAATEILRGRLMKSALVLPLCGLAFVRVWGLDYDDMMKQQYYGWWWGASCSRLAAERLNLFVRDGEKVLITPMYYSANASNPKPCQIFAYYLKDVPVFIVRFDTPVDALVKAIRENQIDWMMISPQPEVGENEVVKPIMQRYGLYPLRLPGAYIFKTDSIYKQDVSPHPE
jgi:4-amino-4-deoxy-L-arabinose transferase-like glycosyltransferase